MSSISFVVQSLTEFADEMEHDYDANAPTVGPETLAVVLTAVRECRSGLATLYDRVEKDLLAAMGEKSMNVEGLGLVEAKKQTKRTRWQNHDLYVRVVARALDERKLDETTGEYESEGAAVARVLEECARPSWRLAPLRELGLDPDEWCDVEPDGWSIKLPGRTL